MPRRAQQPRTDLEKLYQFLAQQLSKALRKAGAKTARARPHWIETGPLKRSRLAYVVRYETAADEFVIRFGVEGAGVLASIAIHRHFQEEFAVADPASYDKIAEM